MIWIVSAAMLVIVFGALWVWMRKPLVHKGLAPRDLRPYLETLLKRGHDRGLLFIRPGSSKEEERFLQFAKYLENGIAGLQFAFPDATWSAHLYGDVRDEVESLGLEATELSTGDPRTRKFLIVDLGQDLEAAQRLVEAVLARAFHVHLDGSVSATFENVSPHDVAIGEIGGGGDHSS